MSGITVRKYGDNETRNSIQFYKSDSVVRTVRGVSEVGLDLQYPTANEPSRTGTANGLLDPPFSCPNVDKCKSRFLEVTSHRSDPMPHTSESIGQSDATEIERIQFVVSNVRNTLKPGRLASTSESGNQPQFAVLVQGGK